MRIIPSSIFAGKNLVRASETIVCNFSDSPITFFFPLVGASNDQRSLSISFFLADDPTIPNFSGRYEQDGLKFNIYLNNLKTIGRPWALTQPLTIKIGALSYLLHSSVIPLHAQTVQVTISLYERRLA